jgi:hypothetical protein
MSLLDLPANIRLGWKSLTLAKKQAKSAITLFAKYVQYLTEDIFILKQNGIV